MRILLTGATGYIAKRLLPTLLDRGHYVICPVRTQQKFDWELVPEALINNVSVIECDFSDAASLSMLPLDIDIAFYLIHSMSAVGDQFESLEATTANNFVAFMNQTQATQIVYLSGIVNDDEKSLSKHLSSRFQVEAILNTCAVPVTTLRAAIIIGSGSASFEIIRDLVEKLPVMITPKWLRTKCQPIAIRNVIQYLTGVLNCQPCKGRSFDIGGPDILTYQKMLEGFADERNLKRLIIPVPTLTPRLSSLWLALITTTSYPLARRLVDSLKNEVICSNDDINQYVTVEPIPYRQALKLAFDKISHKNILSSWRDAGYIGNHANQTLTNMQVPTHGVLTDVQSRVFTRPASEVIENIWSLGGRNGWQSAHWMWRARGVLDKLFGGVGLGRGRRDEKLKTGDAIDFWRVLLADKKNGRLILFAEMKIPGEAWLEFVIKSEQNQQHLIQTATFRPRGLWGRMYWMAMLPFHFLIFKSMSANLTSR